MGRVRHWGFSSGSQVLFNPGLNDWRLIGCLAQSLAHNKNGTNGGCSPAAAVNGIITTTGGGLWEESRGIRFEEIESREPRNVTKKSDIKVAFANNWSDRYTGGTGAEGTVPRRQCLPRSLPVHGVGTLPGP